MGGLQGLECGLKSCNMGVSGIVEGGPWSTMGLRQLRRFQPGISRLQQRKPNPTDRAHLRQVDTHQCMFFPATAPNRCPCHSRVVHVSCRKSAYRVVADGLAVASVFLHTRASNQPPPPAHRLKQECAKQEPHYTFGHDLFKCGGLRISAPLAPCE